MKSKTKKENTMPLHHTLIIIISFFTYNFFSASEYTMHPGQFEHASFFKQMNEHNKTIGKLDSYLFQEYLSNEFLNAKNQNATIEQTSHKIHDEILQHGSIINNGTTKIFNPFYICFFNEDKLKRLESSLKKPDFISDNQLNRTFNERHPEAKPIDHCSYVLQSNGTPIGIICCFFNREIILRLFMKFIKDM